MASGHVSGVSVREEKAPSSPSVHYKTKLCRFYMIGTCAKQNSCNFAHGVSELEPEPDLRYTKLCPRLMHGDECTDKECTFAHHKRELRRFGHKGAAATPSHSPRMQAAQQPRGSISAPQSPAGVRAPGPMLLTSLRQAVVPQIMCLPAAATQHHAVSRHAPAPRLVAERPRNINTDIDALNEGDLASIRSYLDALSVGSIEQEQPASSKCFSGNTTLTNASTGLGGTASSPGLDRTFSLSSDMEHPLVRRVSSVTLGGLANEPVAASVLAAPLKLSGAQEKLYKTKMCAFHLTGKCREGQYCTFAHNQEELRPAPDFSYTRLCPQLLRDGACRNPATCRFAHQQSERRGGDGPFTQQGPSDKELELYKCTPCQGPTSPKLEEETRSKSDTPLSGSGSIVGSSVEGLFRQVSVKNTFINIEPELLEQPPVQRSSSWPARSGSSRRDDWWETRCAGPSFASGPPEPGLQLAAAASAVTASMPAASVVRVAAQGWAGIADKSLQGRQSLTTSCRTPPGESPASHPLASRRSSSAPAALRWWGTAAAAATPPRSQRTQRLKTMPAAHWKAAEQAPAAPPLPQHLLR